MKVLLTTPSYPPFNSGLGNVVRRQAAALSERGFEVAVATEGRARRSRAEGPLQIEEFAVTGAECFHRPIRGDVEGYSNFLTTGGFDVIVMHAWQTWSTDVALQYASRIRARKILYSHCVSTNSFLSYRPIRSAALYALWRPYWWSLADKMRRLDSIVFLAEGGDDDRFDDVAVAKRLGLPMHIIPNSGSGDMLAVDSGGRARSQISAIGSYTAAKGFDFVLRAYAHSSVKNRFPLALFGQEDTAFLSALRDLAGRLGLDPSMLSFNIGVSGEGLLEEYRHSKLILSGSHTECQPLVLIDAMASATPFVARATGCVSHMPGGVAVRSEYEAAGAIDRLLGDEQEWVALSDAGSRAAAGKYGSERNTDLLVSVLRGEK